MKIDGNRIKTLLAFVLTVGIHLCGSSIVCSQEAGLALGLDGHGDFMVVPHSPDLDLAGSFSIEAWIMLHEAGSRQSALVAKGSTEKEWAGYSLLVDSEGFLVFFCGRGETGELKSTVALSADHWYHVACVLRDEKVAQGEIWINGMLDREGVVEYPPHTREPLTIGQWSRAYGFEGEIDELRIFNRALSKDEIESNMNLEMTGRERGIIAYYSFNERTADGGVKDLSPYSHHGALQGDASLLSSEAPVFPSSEAMGEVVGDMISWVEGQLNQLGTEGLRTSSLANLLAEAEQAFQKNDYRTALRHARAAQAMLNEAWPVLRDVAAVSKAVKIEMGKLKKDRIDRSIFDKTISEADEALERGDFEGAYQLMNTVRVNIDKARSVLAQIENLQARIEEVEALGCDVGQAKKMVNKATDAFDRGGYSKVWGFVQDGMALAKQADCGKIKVMNLIAQATVYDGKTIEIKGQIKNLESVYGEGHRIAIDDGTGLVWVEYQGNVKNIDYWKNLDYLDTIIIEGIFSEAKALITATKVR